MLKQSVAFALQALGTLAACVAGFTTHPIAGWATTAIMLTTHGVALEREARGPASLVEQAERGEG